MKKQQIVTSNTSWFDIMTLSDAFACGVADVRAGRGFRASYEQPRPQFGLQQRRPRDLLTASNLTNWQWNYERGRQWAVIAGLNVKLFDEYGPTPEALEIARKAGNDIR